MIVYSKSFSIGLTSTNWVKFQSKKIYIWNFKNTTDIYNFGLLVGLKQDLGEGHEFNHIRPCSYLNSLCIRSEIWRWSLRHFKITKVNKYIQTTTTKSKERLARAFTKNKNWWIINKQTWAKSLILANLLFLSSASIKYCRYSAENGNIKITR